MEDNAAILFIPRTHEATKAGILSHGPTSFGSPASPPSLARQIQACQQTSAYTLTFTVKHPLTCVFLNRKPQDMAVEPKPTIDTTNDVQMETPTEPSAPTPTVAPATRKRPRLDLASEPRERKRGKTMFGLLVGTLNKAKTEDKQRSATDAVRSSFSTFRLSCLFRLFI